MAVTQKDRINAVPTKEETEKLKENRQREAGLVKSLDPGWEGVRRPTTFQADTPPPFTPAEADTDVEFAVPDAFMGRSGRGTPIEEGVVRQPMTNTEWLARMPVTETAKEIAERRGLEPGMMDALVEMGEAAGKNLLAMMFEEPGREPVSPPAAMITPPAKG